MKKRLKLIATICVFAVAGSAIAGCESKPDVSATAPTTQLTTTTAEPELKNQTDPDQVREIPGYTLLWNDEFNGTAMDMTTWNYEPHEPGWTNNELQEYTESEENVFVRDGALVIKAIPDKGYHC